MNLQIYLITWLTAKHIGRDESGNCYYESRFRKRYGKSQRWVIYKGVAEASRIPSAWHAWIHHRSDEVPTVKNLKPWQQPHLPNLTATPYAYAPSQRQDTGLKAPGSYQPWHPN